MFRRKSGRKRKTQTSVSGAASERLRVIDHALKIHHDRRLVPDNPRVVAGGQLGNIARLAISLSAVVYSNSHHAGNVILKMRRLTALGLGDRPDIADRDLAESAFDQQSKQSETLFVEAGSSTTSTAINSPFKRGGFCNRA
jgi:hypothetical protein